MSDVKEKDLPKKNDAAYIRALDSNGNPVLISKADLAQVAAELMPVATITKNGLMSKDDKGSIPYYFSQLNQGIHVFAIKDFSSWVRNGGSVLFIPDSSVELVYFGVYPQDQKLSIQCWHVISAYKGLEFYSKGMSMFIKATVPASNGMIRIIINNMNVDEIDADIIDETYTTIQIQELQ